MIRNAARFDPFGPPWAVGRGYLEPRSPDGFVSPPYVRYVPEKEPAPVRRMLSSDVASHRAASPWRILWTVLRRKVNR